MMKPMPTKQHHDAVTLRKLSVAANCDPRTVRRYLAGQRVAGTTVARLAPVVAAAGIAVETIETIESKENSND